MPHSTHFPITAVMTAVTRLRPRTVLDVGVGYGKWGFLVREALDFVDDRHERSEWQTRIDGIEVFEGYRSPLYDWVYDSVTYGDVRDLAPQLPPYDLVILGDVIEHLTKDDGLRVLRQLLARSRNVVVATPVEFFTQDILDNPHEQHLSVWSIEDFAEWAVDYEVVGNTTVVATLAGAGATWPARREDRASRLAHQIPGVRDRSLAAQLAKSVIGRVVR